MKNFVISLTTATQRREHITQEFSKQNIPFEFFDAITPDTMVQACERLNIDLINNQRLSGGEKGCFLSHVILWQKMLDENLDYIAIFEDDIYLGENAQVFFNDENWLKNNQIDFIKTETFLQKRKLGSESILLVDNRSAKPLKEYHLGTAGYIISQKTALSLLKRLIWRMNILRLTNLCLIDICKLKIVYQFINYFLRLFLKSLYFIHHKMQCQVI